MNRNEQSGRSMVEILGVLAIVGVLSVGGIAGYSKAMAKFKLTKTQDQLQMMVMNIRTAYVTSPGFPDLNTAHVIEYKLASSEMMVDSKNLLNAFGGKVYVEATENLERNSDGAFAILYAGLGRDSCVSLATSDWGTDGLIGIYVDSTTDPINKIENPNALSKEQLKQPSELPISLTTAREKCSSDNNNLITWYYL